MISRKLLVLTTALALSVSGSAFAQAKRTILQRQDIAGSTKESVVGVGDLTPGAHFGRHTHPGEEVGYVVQGPVTFQIEGQPDKVLNTGDAYVIPSGVVHDALASPDKPAKLAAVWIVEKGKPMATPAPAK